MFTLVLSGCLASSPDRVRDGTAPDDVGAQVPNGTRAPLHLSDSTSGTFSAVEAGAGFLGVEGDNCVRYDEGGVTAIEQGEVNVSWSSPSPAHDEMQIVVFSRGPERIQATGASPLRVEVPPTEVDGPLYISFQAPGEAGVVSRVEYAMQWKLSYAGEASPTWQAGTCDASA